MGVDFALARAAADTVGASQDITVGSFGTPKACMVLITSAVANATATDHVMLGVGMYDGTTQIACTIGCVHGGGTSATRRRLDVTYGAYLQHGDNTNKAQGVISFITDGIRITWSGTQPAAAYLITVLLWTGSDFTGYVNRASVHPWENETTEVTGVGFEADQLWLTSAGNLGDARMFLGCVDNGDSIVQRGTSFWSDSGKADADIEAMIRDDAIGSETDGSPHYEVTAFDGDGFDITTRGSASNDVYIAFLALHYGGVKEHSLATWQTPAATGDVTVGSLGYTPDGLIGVFTEMPALNTNYATGAAGSFGIGADDGTNEYSVSIADEDAAADMDTQSLVDTKFINKPMDDGADQAVATAAFTAGTITITYTDVDTTNAYNFGLAWGTSDEAGTVAPQVIQAYKRINA